MSVYQQNVRAFIEVVQSGLIPEPDKQDLIRSVNNWPDNDEQICEEIEKWLEVENRGRISAAYDEKLGAIVAAEKPIEMGPGNTHSNTPPDQPGETLKELLTNTLQPIYSSLKSSESEKEEAPIDYVDSLTFPQKTMSKKRSLRLKY